MRFYGRQTELHALRHALQTVRTAPSARLVLVSGRRRTGRTALVSRAFEQAPVPVLHFLVGNDPEAALCRHWAARIASAFLVEEADVPPLSSAVDVIGWLLKLSSSAPAVCILDDCERLEHLSPDFFGRLETLWRSRPAESRLLLVLCGTLSGMESEGPSGATGDASFVNPDENAPEGSLKDLADASITLGPLPPSAIIEIAREELPFADAADILGIHALTGGVPKHIAALADFNALSIAKAVDLVFSPQGGLFRAEGDVILAEACRVRTPYYEQVLQAIGAGAERWADIQAGADAPISTYMMRLERFGLIERRNPVLEKVSQRQVRYRIRSPYMNFWLRYVAPTPLRELSATGGWEALRQNCRRTLPAYLEGMLAEWHALRRREEGGWSEAGSWWNRSGTESIDLVAVDRTNRRIEFGSARLHPNEGDDAALREKVARFLSAHPELREWTCTCRRLAPESGW